ncbi:hypothetical protein PMAC_002537 [Pneumocystis sp. 'macacae']|nr:hypothetical protein PMAC_002537 [Pneumocystis sp. 'macacae']
MNKDIENLNLECKKNHNSNIETNSSNDKSEEFLGKNRNIYTKIYTDGSVHYIEDGKTIVGIGVYFGVKDKRKVLKCVIGLKQTNQRAEIMAVIRAIESVSNHENILINTDSEYIVNALTSIKNVDLLKKVLKLIEERSGYRKLKYVVGHKGIHGNELANYFANMGFFLLKKDRIL